MSAITILVHEDTRHLGERIAHFIEKNRAALGDVKVAFAYIGKGEPDRVHKVKPAPLSQVRKIMAERHGDRLQTVFTDTSV